MEYRILTAPLASLNQGELTDTDHGLHSIPSPNTILRNELFQKMGPVSPTIPPVAVKKRSFSVGETDMRSLWKNFHLKSRSADQQRPQSTTRPIKILKLSSTSASKSPSQCSTDSTGTKSSRRQLIFDKKEGDNSPDNSPFPSNPTTPTIPLSVEASPREATWQTKEQERRHNEEMLEQLRQAEDGTLGNLHVIYTDLARQWLDFERESKISSVNKVTEKLKSRYSVDLVLLALVTKLPQVCSDTTFRLFKKTKDGFELFQPQGPKRNRFPADQPRNSSRPGTQENFVLIGRNIHQWRYCLDYQLTEEEAISPDLINPQTRKSFQQFPPCDLGSTATGDVSKLMDLKGNSQSSHFIPRQRLILLYVKEKECILYTYNWSKELVHSLETFFHRLIMWHNSRSHLVECLVMQKMGLYHHRQFGDTGQADNPFCKYMSEIDGLVKQILPPSQSASSHGPPTSSPRSQRRRHPVLPPFDETMAVGKIPRPMHTSAYNLWNDPVLRHGAQLQEMCHYTRKDNEVQLKLHNLYVLWQQKKRSQPPITLSSSTLETLETLKQQSRLLTHCATPMLFSPEWRKHVLLDHFLPSPCASEGTWHTNLRKSFLSQYIQYLKSRRFRPIEITPLSPPKGFGVANWAYTEGGAGQLPEGYARKIKTTSVTYMQVTVLGGIVLAELLFEHVFFAIRLYVFESSRLPREHNITSRLDMRFADDCDRFKDLIHLNSFSYDFHLRTIQDCLNSSGSFFKMNYHVTDFLSDFIKFFTPTPRFCKTLISCNIHGFHSHNTPAPDLYNYFTSHKPSDYYLINMMKPHLGEDQEPEKAIFNYVRTRPRRGINQEEISFIISWDEMEYENCTRPVTPVSAYLGEAASLPSQSDSEKNKYLMKLKYYMIVTSAKDVHPDTVLKKGHCFVSQGTDIFTDKYVKEQNPRRQRMQIELPKKIEALKSLVKEAATNCRRDMLWDKLLCYELDSTSTSKKSKKKDASESIVEPSISYADFQVLMESVSHISLTDTDPCLVRLLDNSRMWYDNLLQTLQVKFNIMARYFKREDDTIHQLALLNPGNKSMIFLLTVDFQTNSVKLEAVFRDKQDLKDDSQESPNHIDKHIENVINSICFHLWSSIL